MGMSLPCAPHNLGTGGQVLLNVAEVCCVETTLAPAGEGGNGLALLIVLWASLDVLKHNKRSISQTFIVRSFIVGSCCVTIYCIFYFLILICACHSGLYCIQHRLDASWRSPSSKIIFSPLPCVKHQPVLWGYLDLCQILSWHKSEQAVGSKLPIPPFSKIRSTSCSIVP